MSWGASAAVAIMAASTTYTIAAGEDASRKQGHAQEEAKQQALKQETLSDQATNRANQKKPDISAILSAAQQASKSGGSTMLTGPGGIDPNALTLGKTNLLGG